MWILDQEGASHWLKIFNDLRSREIPDIFIAGKNGLTGITKAIEEVFSRTIHQTCIVHLIRSSTAFLSYKDRSGVLPLKKDLNLHTEPYIYIQQNKKYFKSLLDMTLEYISA